MKAMKALTMAVVAILLAGALPAQEPEAAPEPPPRRMRVHEPGTGLQGGPAVRQRMGMGGELAGMWAFAPQALLQRRDLLQLTDDQVSRLEQLGEELKGVHEQAMEQVRSSQEALREAWQADQPDADTVRRYAQQAMQARQTAQLAVIDGAVRAKALLTPEQQGKLQGWLDGMRAGRRGHAGMRQGGGGYRQDTPWRRP